jgi:formylglycine-generating enzyme required for sulfatase activity
MHCNVCKWCHDYYEEDYYQQLPKKNPSGPARQVVDEKQQEELERKLQEGTFTLDDFKGQMQGSARVLRGGAWYSRARYPRSAYRNRGGADSRGIRDGFRLVRELD